MLSGSVGQISNGQSITGHRLTSDVILAGQASGQNNRAPNASEYSLWGRTTVVRRTTYPKSLAQCPHKEDLLPLRILSFRCKVNAYPDDVATYGDKLLLIAG